MTRLLWTGLDEPGLQYVDPPTVAGERMKHDTRPVPSNNGLDVRNAVTAGVNGPRRSRLVTLVQRFVQADSWSASRVLAERHPALLSGDADDILTSLRALASARGDGAAVHTFEVHQALLRRYREVGGAAFDEVIAPGVPAALRSQWIAAEAAYERYRARPSRAAADSAIDAITPVLRHDDLAAVPATARAGMQQAAGTLLGERYQRHGSSPADLDAAVTCFTAAVHDLPDNDPDRPSYASALGNVLGMRFEERGDPADLDAAIQWSRVATAAMPADERWWILHNLSANLGIRHELAAPLTSPRHSRPRATPWPASRRKRPSGRSWPTTWPPCSSIVTNATAPSTTCGPAST